MNFSGTGVALVTPFNPQGQIDFEAFKKLIHHISNGGADYLVIQGTTGESVTLSPDEKIEIFKSAAEFNEKKTPLVAGIGGNNTYEVLQNFEKYPLDQYQGILSVSPYYNKPNQEGIFLHYQEINKFTPLPLLAYNVPGRTGSNMSAETTLRIANGLPQIKGIKEASGNFDQCMAILENVPPHFQVISGDDAYTYPFMCLGMSGVVSVMANIFPKAFSDMVNMAIQKNWDSAKKIHFKLLPLTRLIFADGNPGGAKVALHELGLMLPNLRLPLGPVNKEIENAIRKEVNRLQHEWE